MSENIVTKDNFEIGKRVKPSLKALEVNPEYYNKYTEGVLTALWMGSDDKILGTMVKWDELSEREGSHSLHFDRLVFVDYFKDCYKALDKLEEKLK